MVTVLQEQDGPGKLLKTWSDHTDTVWQVNFSPDGQHLISASEDKTLRLWHHEKGLIQTLSVHTGGVWCAVFSPDAQRVASGGADGVIRLWTVVWRGLQDIYLDETPVLLKGHRDWVRSLCFSPNGQFLASASDDETIRLWSVTSRPPVVIGNPLTDHEGVVWDVSFDSAGKRLVSAGADGSVRIWDLDLSSLMAKGCSWLSDWMITRPELRQHLCERRESE